LNKWAVVHNCMDSECPTFLLVYRRIKHPGIWRHITVTTWSVMQLWVAVTLGISLHLGYTKLCTQMHAMRVRWRSCTRTRTLPNDPSPAA
jgi:hypothetical protein